MLRLTSHAENNLRDPIAIYRHMPYIRTRGQNDMREERCADMTRDDDLLTAPVAADELGVHRDTTRRAAADGQVPGAIQIGKAWVATESAWRTWHQNRRSAGRPTREESIRMEWTEHLATMTPAEAWEGFVGDQSPVDFFSYSTGQGAKTYEEAAERYAQDMPTIAEEWRRLTGEHKSRIAALLERYLEQSLGPTLAQFVGRLNSYRGNNIWEDVIRRHPRYDDDATAAADPSGMSDTIILSDGSIIDYAHHLQTWR